MSVSLLYVLFFLIFSNVIEFTVQSQLLYTLQILQVTAVDLDTGNNARLSYRLYGSNAFRISPNTGWIYLAQSLDRETLDHHALTILATDNGSPAATASTSVLVTVLDDNDNDPRFEKDFYGFELLENLPSGTLVGAVSASDPDLGKNSLLRYAVVQANSSFAVDPDTGKRTTFLLSSNSSFYLCLRSPPPTTKMCIGSCQNDTQVFVKATRGRLRVPDGKLPTPTQLVREEKY